MNPDRRKANGAVTPSPWAGNTRPFSIPSAFRGVLHGEHPTAHRATRAFFRAHFVNERRATQGPLEDVGVNASPRLFQSFDDLHRRGWTVCAKPLHNPVRLLAVGFALVAPAGRTSHAKPRAAVHIKPCLSKVEAVRDAPRSVKNEQELVVRLPPSGSGQGPHERPAVAHSIADQWHGGTVDRSTHRAPFANTALVALHGPT